MENIIDKLNANYPFDTQREAVLQLVGNYHIDPSLLIQPISKPHWANAALVLLMWGPKRVEKYIPELLAWLQDLNWPGTYYVMELLFQFDEHMLRPLVEKAKTEAMEQEDDVWIRTLDKIFEKEWRNQVIFQNHTRPYR